MHPGAAVTLFWGLFVLSWLAAAFWTRRAEKRVGMGNELPYRVVLVLGYVLLFHLRQRHPIPGLTWHPTEIVARIAAIASLAGFFFAWWARLHLGRLWSSAITRKAGHHVVASGPYGIVRHPIYTGLLLAVLATAIAKATPAGLLAVALFAAGFWWKARLEEHWLAQELPEGDYAAYRRRVPMLLPLGPRGA